MGKGKKKAPKAAPRGPKEKHKRQQQDALDPKAPPPPNLAALGVPKIPAVKSKHHSYFEFVENKGHKKKKLEFQVAAPTMHYTTDTVQLTSSQITSKIEPPPGFKFVPISSTNLTKACKELSREKDAMIFIVSVRMPHHSASCKPWFVTDLARNRAPTCLTSSPTSSTAPATTYEGTLSTRQGP
jgi:hypothetical protein